MLNLGIQLVLSLTVFYSLYNNSVSIMLSVGVLSVHLIFYLLSVLSNKAVRNKITSIHLILLCGGTLWLDSMVGIISFWTIGCYWNKQYKGYFYYLIAGITLYIWLIDWQLQYLYYTFFSLTLLWIQVIHGKSMDQIKILNRVNNSYLDENTMLRKQLEQMSKKNTQVKYMTQMSERHQIAQKLHDKMGHVLAGNIMKLEACALIVEEHPARARKMTLEVSQKLREGMDEIRMILREVRPKQSEIGLQGIKKVLDEFKENTNIETYCYYEGDLLQLSYIQWQVVKDNLLEALTNSQKHSTCTVFEVRIYSYNKVIKVILKDNGKVTKSFKKGMGLMGIEERTISTGGNVNYILEEGFEIIMVWEKQDD